FQAMRSERGDGSLDEKVFRVAECQKALDRACRKVGADRITHHDLRHLFATRCIEAGVDIPTVSRWLGHKDGGALALKTYGHLRDQHSTAMAQKVMFSGSTPKAVGLPRSGSSAGKGKAVPTQDTEKEAIGHAKAKYSYPWWASENPLEVFWGQVNEGIQIVPSEKYHACAQKAMGRVLFKSELSPTQALI